MRRLAKEVASGYTTAPWPECRSRVRTSAVKRTEPRTSLEDSHAQAYLRERTRSDERIR